MVVQFSPGAQPVWFARADDISKQPMQQSDGWCFGVIVWEVKVSDREAAAQTLLQTADADAVSGRNTGLIFLDFQFDEEVFVNLDDIDGAENAETVWRATQLLSGHVDGRHRVVQHLQLSVGVVILEMAEK